MFDESYVIDDDNNTPIIFSKRITLKPKTILRIEKFAGELNLDKHNLSLENFKKKIKKEIITLAHSNDFTFGQYLTYIGSMIVSLLENQLELSFLDLKKKKSVDIDPSNTFQVLEIPITKLGDFCYV